MTFPSKHNNPTASPANSSNPGTASWSHVVQFPPELTSKKNWLCWELTVTDAGLKKMPRNPITGGPASCDNPSTWVDFETAKQAVKEGRYDSIGIALTKELGLAIVDFDKVREPHEPMPQWVRSQIANLDSYTEISASGTGAHVLAWSNEDLPNINRQEQHCEIHFKNKMFALSGVVFEGHKTIHHRSLAVLHKRIADELLYRPMIIAVGNETKYRDVVSMRYAKYGLGRSEAIQSALAISPASASATPRPWQASLKRRNCVSTGVISGRGSKTRR
jgi:hypothetical protein